MTLKLIIQVTHIRRAASMCVTLSRGGWLSDDTHDYDDTTDQWSWPFRLQTFACRGSQSSQWQWWLAHSGWLYRDKFNQSNGWRLDGDDDDDEVDFDDDDDDDYDHYDDDHLGSSSREASLAVALSVVTPCSCEERRSHDMCARQIVRMLMVVMMISTNIFLKSSRWESLDVPGRSLDFSALPLLAFPQQGSLPSTSNGQAFIPAQLDPPASFEPPPLQFITHNYTHPCSAYKTSDTIQVHSPSCL